MEAVALLSLCCNVFQLLDHTCQVLKFLKQLRDDNAPHGSLPSHAKSIRLLGYEVKQSVEAHIQTQELTESDKRLCETGQSLADAAVDLERLLTKLTKSRLDRVGLGGLERVVKFLWKKGDMEGLTRRIDLIKKDVDSQILVDLRRKMCANADEMRMEWKNMRDDMRKFAIDQLKAIDETLASQFELLSAEIQGVRDHVRLVQTGVTDVQHTLSSEFQRVEKREVTAKVERFIQSFRFEGMNERRNQSSIAHSKGSFEWIYGASELDDDEPQADSDNSETDGDGDGSEPDNDDGDGDGDGDGDDGSETGSDDSETDHDGSDMDDDDLERGHSAEQEVEGNVDGGASDTGDNVAEVASITSETDGRALEMDGVPSKPEDSASDMDDNVTGAYITASERDDHALEMDDVPSRVEGDVSQVESKNDVSEMDDDVIQVEESAKLLHWLQSDQDLFWVSGKPGSGKSTLMNFIIRDPRTVKNLSKPHLECQTIVLDAFLFKPAQSLMQKSAKGMLCTLIHGLLIQEPEVARRLQDTIPTAAHKTSPSDWARDELVEVLKQAIERVGRRVCIFIDGLDEVDGHDTDHQSICKIVDSIRRIPKVKVCVASRPEPVFESRLQRYPHLRLHNLTRRDVYRFALAELREEVELDQQRLYQGESQELDELASRITFRAEGVFLWASLAVKNIRRGMACRENWDTLGNRLGNIPSGLINIYKEMWNRLGDDEKNYRRDAARFFGLILSLDERMPWKRRLLVAMLLSHPDERRTLSHDSSSIDRDHLAGLCLETAHRIRAITAGFLEVQAELTAGGSDVDRLSLVGRKTVAFIHRSMFDFLKEEGRGILESGELAPTDVFESIVVSDLLFPKLLEDSVVYIASPGWRTERWVSYIRQSVQVPSSDFENCVQTIRLAVAQFHWLPASRRSVVELFAVNGFAEGLKCCISSSTQVLGSDEIVWDRLLLLALLHSIKTNDFDSLDLVCWLLKKVPNLDHGAGVDSAGSMYPTPGMLVLLFLFKNRSRVYQFLPPHIAAEFWPFIEHIVASNQPCVLNYDGHRLGYFGIPTQLTHMMAVWETNAGMLWWLTCRDWDWEAWPFSPCDKARLRPLADRAQTTGEITALLMWDVDTRKFYLKTGPPRRHLDWLRAPDSFEKHFAHKHMRKMWRGRRCEILGGKEAVEWLVQKRYVKPSALKLDDDLVSVVYEGHLLL